MGRYVKSDSRLTMLLFFEYIISPATNNSGQEIKNEQYPFC